jgi:transposase
MRREGPCQEVPTGGHSPHFKLQLCHDIRAGTVGRKEAQRKYSFSANLVHLWLTQYDRGELDAEEVEATLVTEYEGKIAALERKVGQLTMELDLLKKAPRLRLVSDRETSLIITGPKAAPSDGGAK